MMQSLPLGDDRNATIERMKDLAARSGDALSLCNEPVAPDWRLLDLCADALHYSTAAEKADAARDLTNSPMWDDVARAAYDKRDGELMAANEANKHEVVQRLRRAKK